jgi:hypothetical protein
MPLNFIGKVKNIFLNEFIKNKKAGREFFFLLFTLIIKISYYSSD